MIEGYKLGKVIQQGGFGIVQEAERIDDGVECAIKRPKGSLNETQAARFRREVRLQAQLIHPNIVPILDMDLAADPPWFAMPRARESFREHLSVQHDQATVIRLLIEAGRGLDYAHRNGIIHRDMKPDNILLFAGEGATLAAVSDFGLGRDIIRQTPTLTPSHHAMGTPTYMAPEQLSDSKYADHRADIYSMGRILFQVLSGQLPEFNTDIDLSLVPAKYCYVTRRATKHSPEDRYQSMIEFLEDLGLVAHVGSTRDRPSDVALEIYARLLAPDAQVHSLISDLARLFVENRDDYHLMVHVLPRIPQEGLSKWVRTDAELFKIVVQSYDELISEPLAFDYCDVVARFYEHVFDLCPDFDVRTLILCRIADMGSSYDRWELGQLFARLFGEVRDPLVLDALSAFVGSDPAVAMWLRDFLRGLSLPPVLRSAVFAR